MNENMEEDYKLTKWLNDELTQEELTEFENSSDFAVYQKIKKYTNELKTPVFNEETMLETILLSKTQNQKSIPLYQQWYVKIAAIIVLFIGIGYFLTVPTTEIQLAEKGKKNTFNLPDNSNVILNADSEIAYQKTNWEDNRHLNLKGEAYFKVAKGKKFQVITNLGIVTVLGTQFNVKTRDNRFDVECYEGKVKVNYKNHEVIITKNQTISFENGKQSAITNTLDAQPSWLENEIKFNKNNLNSIIKELERQYNIVITTNSNNNTQLFTGTIPTNNLQSALQIITSTYHLQSQKVNTNKYILETVNAN